MSVRVRSFIEITGSLILIVLILGGVYLSGPGEPRTAPAGQCYLPAAPQGQAQHPK